MPGGDTWGRLAVAFVLIASFFVVELVADPLAQSLALLSDAAHMAADAKHGSSVPGPVNR